MFDGLERLAQLRKAVVCQPVAGRRYRFVVLLFVIFCTVGSLLAAMVSNKPLVSALGIALMSAPLAATVAAAVLHGIYFCEHVSRCFLGLIPY